ncbi:MAG TPA: outer membrane lipoprotein carrier protein LolA, partial [Alphaproteobacteria bacterium]
MKHILLVFAFLLMSFPVYAAEKDSAPPSVQKAEEYLRHLDTVQARFLQTASDGSQFIGTFYLDRPGKL